MPLDMVSELEVHLSTCNDCRSVIAEAASMFASQDATHSECSATHHDREHSNRNVELLPGTQVSRYIISNVIGTGAAGIVYRAYDPELKRHVALKLLRSEQARTEGTLRARLLREAQAMAQLSHPNVVSVFDVGTFGEEVFVVLELVQGVTLGSWLSEPHGWQAITAAFLDAGKGLAAAHAVKLVHRDFKPANVLVGLDGRVRVTDFGLARAQQFSQRAGELWDAELAQPAEAIPFVHATLTQTGELAGTPIYMAPEQFARRPADEQSDQFAFCVALYWALYRKHPYLPASSRSPSLLELVLALQSGALNAPADSSVPTALFDTLRTGLALEPARRFGSMQELLNELAAVLRDNTIEKRTRTRRLRTLAVSAVAASVALTALISALTHAPSAPLASQRGIEFTSERMHQSAPASESLSPPSSAAAIDATPSSVVASAQKLRPNNPTASSSVKRSQRKKAVSTQPTDATIRQNHGVQSKASSGTGLKQYNDALKDPF